MITGIGIDIVEVDRIKRLLKNKKFIERVFTPLEIKEAEGCKIKYQRLASRFAAKEAVKKAVDVSLSFKEIEIVKGGNGSPMVYFLGSVKKNIPKGEVLISLSHTEKYAIAIALVLTKPVLAKAGIRKNLSKKQNK